MQTEYCLGHAVKSKIGQQQRRLLDIEKLHLIERL
jgi:hypothetical protein